MTQEFTIPTRFKPTRLLTASVLEVFILANPVLAKLRTKLTVREIRVNHIAGDVVRCRTMVSASQRLPGMVPGGAVVKFNIAREILVKELSRAVDETPPPSAVTEEPVEVKVE